MTAAFTAELEGRWRRWTAWPVAPLTTAAEGAPMACVFGHAQVAAHLAWTRRARLHGDGWETEVPLGEEREVYRVEVLDGETVVWTVEVGAPTLVYTATMRAADFPGGPSGVLSVRVAQGSAIYGWGAGRQRLL